MTLARQELSEKLIDNLHKLHGATSSGIDESEKEKLFQDFFSLLDDMSLDLLPYSAASQFIYSNINDEGFYFIQAIEEKIVENFKETDETYKKGLKIVEHLELAQQQKEALFAKQEKKIKEYSYIQDHLIERTHKIEEIQKTTKKLQKDTELLQTQNNKMITNFITILGIFAAILMGAFGSIQAFSSLFDNAVFLDLGKLLIISSVGASSVVLILFFLLNGIAKLTDRSLSSSKTEDSTILEKHPTLVIVHGILIFIALIGAALELSSVKLRIAAQGLWWFIPLIWIIYFIIACHQNTFFPFLNKTKSTSDSNKKA